jgi:hypothetical protein
MPYYPKSQVTTNLNTSGGELAYVNGQEYIGYYWKNSKGQFFTGKTPQDRPTEKLVKINYNEDNFLERDTATIVLFPSDPDPILLNSDSLISVSDYIKLKRINNLKIFLPYYSPTLPTQQDYQNGEMRRYFCKKTNEVIYLERNKETYDKLITQDPQILWQLYLPFNLSWQLTGNKEDVYKTNKNITELTSFRLKLPMLSKYLKDDFTKYYK